MTTTPKRRPPQDRQDHWRWRLRTTDEFDVGLVGLPVCLVTVLVGVATDTFWPFYAAVAVVGVALVLVLIFGCEVS